MSGRRRVGVVTAGLLWFRRSCSLVSTTRTLAAPEWTATPTGCVEVSAYEVEVAAPVSVQGQGADVVRRLLAEVRADVAPDGGGAVRQSACWLSCPPPVSDDQAVRVHIGQYEVGTLGVLDSTIARDLIHRVAVGDDRVGTFAELRGTKPAEAVLTVFFDGFRPGNPTQI